MFTPACIYPTRNSHRKLILVRLFAATLILSLLSSCIPPVGPNLTPDPIDLGNTPASPSSISVYFTDPGKQPAGWVQPDLALADAIRQARVSVDVAIYDLNLWSIRDALLAAHSRGVAVRIVTESDNLDEQELQDLKAAGIPLLGDRREGLMHNKFLVIDREQVWTGSMNLTLGAVERDDNNLIRIRSTRLAQDYTTEFEEMFVDDEFGSGSPANTPYPQLDIDGVTLEVYFSPDDGTASHLVRLIQSAQKSVYFLAYSFTSDEIAQAMLERAQAGVTVSGVFEKAQYSTNTGTEYDTLRAAGLDIRLDGNPSAMHHKVILIDGQIVITGSYNFSKNAETRNDENTLVIHDLQVAAQYQQEFARVFSEAKP